MSRGRDHHQQPRTVEIAALALASVLVGLAACLTAPRAADAPTPGIGNFGNFTFVTPPATSSLTIGGEKVIIITQDGVVRNGSNVPLDELPPAEQLETMCAAISHLARHYTGVEVTRCGKL